MIEVTGTNPATTSIALVHANSRVKRFATIRIIDTEMAKSAAALANETKLMPKAVAVPAWFLKLSPTLPSPPNRGGEIDLP
jgi:hypothetical protein